MQTIGIVGANGYLGSAIFDVLTKQSSDTIIAITRDNYADKQQGTYDILINCAMPSARFWAKHHPGLDFKETVEKTANLLYSWQSKKIVQISTVSARCQLDTVYGRHKAAAEKLLEHGDHLIVRLGAVYSPEMKKGVLMDMMQDKTVFVDGDSRYCFAPRDFIAHWIASNLHRSGLIEVGGKNAISLKQIAERINSKSVFEGAIDHQEIASPESDFPEASDVLTFLESLKK